MLIKNNSSWMRELRATYRLAWPLILVQLLHTSLGATDVVMMSWLGSGQLAAGGTAVSFYFTFVIFGIGVVGAVTPLVAQAIGAQDLIAVRRSLRQGLWVAIMLSIVLVACLSQSELFFGLLQQKPVAIKLSVSYLLYASWSIFPILLMTAFRSFLSAHDDTKIILLITIIGFFLNLVGNYTLMFGNFGFPKLGLMGAGIATTLVQLISTGLIILYITIKKKYQHYHIFVRFWRADWQKFTEIIRIGIPVGLTAMAEVGLFSAAYFLMGMLSIQETAAHAVAIQIASITFMIPLGLSFATTVRVGLAYGKGDIDAIKYAGWVSIILALGVMTITCLMFVFIPELFVYPFLDPVIIANASTIELAAGYLFIAGIFQLVDGVQVVCSASLRGLSDTKIPMYIAIASYWLFGFPISYILAFNFEMRGEGVWIGLAMGLTMSAIILLIRFIMRDKLGLTKFKRQHELKQ